MDQYWGRSLDVVGLHSNIPIQETINAAVDMLEVHEKEIGMLDLEVEDVKNLLEHIMQNIVFQFGDRQFRQKNSIAMSNNLAPPLAIVFMHRLEKRVP